MPQTPSHHRPALRLRAPRWIAAAAAAAAAVAGIARVTGWPMSDVTMLGCTTVAAVGFFRARRASALGRSLALLGWSATAWVAGVGLWLGIESLSRSASGLNPVSGSIMLAGSGLALAGVLLLPGAPSSAGSRLRLALDCLLVAVSILFVAWRPIVEPAMATSHRSLAMVLATLSLPVADTVILAAVGAVLWRATGGRTLVALLAASAAVRTGTDVRFAVYAFGGFAGHGDALIDIGWATSYALLALAAVASGTPAVHAQGRTRRRPPDRRLQLLLYLPIGVALVTAARIGLVDRRMHGPQLTVMLLIAALLLARQWVTLGENRSLLQRVAFQAEHDDLTGLLNRAGLLRRVSEAVAAGAAVRVHLIDINRFKDVNDTLGHPVGDGLLRAIGNRLQSAARGLQVARLGGDEFAVIDGRHDGPGLAERLLQAIGQPYSAAGRAIHLDASLGIAEREAAPPGHEPGDPDRVAVDLLRDADFAMYEAKAGGGGVRLFEDELRRAMLDRVAIGHELRDALARGELSLAYQPVVDLPSAAVTHVEALVRWSHPQLGSVPPGIFIPIAEASGLMPILGRWVLRTACAQAAAWNRDGFDIGICVNVSAQQLDDHGIVRDVSETLRRTRLAPGRLILELTESLFVDDSDAVRGPLEALRAAGSRIAIDDFGTGYSALSYLRRLPVDTLKLDRRFLAELGSADVAVLTAILSLARTLGLQTIAEGIETPEQLAVLRRLGCDFGQGYYLARPMDAAAVTELLRGPLAHAA
jgi:diguanylate cyclase